MRTQNTICIHVHAPQVRNLSLVASFFKLQSQQIKVHLPYQKTRPVKSTAPRDLIAFQVPSGSHTKLSTRRKSPNNLIILFKVGQEGTGSITHNLLSNSWPRPTCLAQFLFLLQGKNNGKQLLKSFSEKPSFLGYALNNLKVFTNTI